MILNVSPLIHITRAGYSWIFREFKGLIIPQAVYKDVVIEGRKKGVPDALIIEELVTEKIIKISQIKNKEFYQLLKKAASNLDKPLHLGEVEVLTLAKEKGDVAIIDEAPARHVGKVFNIKVKGSMYLFTHLFRRKLIKKAELMKALENMVKSGWRLSPEDHEKIRDKLTSL